MLFLVVVEGHSDGELHKNRDASAQQDVWVWDVKQKKQHDTIHIYVI